MLLVLRILCAFSTDGQLALLTAQTIRLIFVVPTCFLKDPALQLVLNHHDFVGRAELFPLVGLLALFTQVLSARSAKEFGVSFTF